MVTYFNTVPVVRDCRSLGHFVCTPLPRVSLFMSFILLPLSYKFKKKIKNV